MRATIFRLPKKKRRLKSCVRKKERNERGKRKGSRKKQESFVQLKLKVRRRLTKKNRIRQQLISHRTCAVSVYSHMNRTSNKAQEQSGWSVFTVDGSMKDVLIM